MEAALEAMAETPLSEPEKLATLLLISGFVRNDATLSSDVTAARGAEPPSHTYGAILSELAGPAHFPAVHRVIASGEFDDDDEDFDAVFDYGLERILDGIDTLIRRKRREARDAQDTTLGESPPAQPDSGCPDGHGKAERPPPA